LISVWGKKGNQAIADTVLTCSWSSHRSRRHHFGGASRNWPKIHRFLCDEQAATATEYGLIASLIAVAIIAGATALGTLLNSTFQSI